MGSALSPRVDQKQSQNSVPAWLENAAQWNIDQGQQLAGREYTAYDGQRQAEFNPMQNQAFNTANYYGQMAPGAFEGAYDMYNDTSGQGMMGNAYGQMQGMFDGLGGEEGGGVGYNAYNAQQSQAMLGDRGNVRDVEGGSYLGMDRDAYTNQYTQGVSDNVFSDINRQSQQQGNQIGADASAAGAFGGSRHGVQGALQQSEAQRNYGQMSNMLNNQAFDNASGLMGNDLNRALQAGGMNQNQDASMEQMNAQLGTQNNQFNAGQINAARGQNAQGGMMADYYNQANQQANQQANNSTRASLLNSMMQGGQGLGYLNLAQGGALEGFGQGGMNAQLGAGNQIQQHEQQGLSGMFQDFMTAQNWSADNFKYANAGMPTQGMGGTNTEDVFSPGAGQQILGAGTALGGAAMGKPG